MFGGSKCNTFRRRFGRGPGIRCLALRGHDSEKPQRPCTWPLSRDASAASEKTNQDGHKSSSRPSEKSLSFERPENPRRRSYPRFFFGNFLTFSFPVDIQLAYSRQKKLHNRPQALLSKRAHERSRNRTEGPSKKSNRASLCWRRFDRAMR
jgi:hypothetical protein